MVYMVKKGYNYITYMYKYDVDLSRNVEFPNLWSRSGGR